VSVLGEGWNGAAEAKLRGAPAAPPPPSYQKAKVRLYCDVCCTVNIEPGEWYTKDDGRTICSDCRPIPPEARWGDAPP
jgi:hypothetical protein